MILVILGHACAFWSGHWFTENPAIQSRSLDILYSWINSFHIYAFALVSGYIFAFKIIGGGYRKYLPFMKNKSERLLVPYLFVMLIWVAPISAYFFNWKPAYMVKKYLFCIDPSQLWFLWMLFGVFAIVWPLRKVLLDKPILGYIIAVIFYGFGTVGKRMVPNAFCVWTACQYIPFFFIGMRILAKEYRHERLITRAVPWSLWLVLDVILFVGVTLVSRQNGVIWSLISLGLTFLLHVVGAVMAWTILQALAIRTPWKESRIFKTLSAYSMPMYLFHQQIIYFTITYLNGKVNPWINAGINFVVAFIGSLFISVLLTRWKVTRILIGEKE